MVHSRWRPPTCSAEAGVEAEVIDPRTLGRSTWTRSSASVETTGRAVVVDEGHRSYGVTAEIAAAIAEGAASITSTRR